MKYAVLFLLLLTACVINRERNSRYSVDITKLKQEELIKDTWVYRHPKVKPTNYQQFLLMPITVYENTAKKVKKHDRPILDAFGERLTKQTNALFAKDYTLAAAPDIGVLEINIAIVDIKPIVNYINKDGYEAVRYDGTAIGTKLEMDCVDAVTREPILVLSTLYKGEQYAAHENLAYLGNVEKAFEEWTRFFKNRFDQAMQSVTPAPSPK